MRELIDHTEGINRLLARYGVKLGLYKNGTFHEQLFPFDAIPRVISHQEFEYLEKGLIQRVDALNLFLEDVYGEKKIIKDGVVPEEFVFSSSGYLLECEGMKPPKRIHSHISGIDLVLGKDGEWYILEDNLRIPSGASYPMIAREICRQASPETFRNNPIVDNRNYADLLKETMAYVNTGGVPVIMTPGRYNAAYFEHSYLAERTDSELAMCTDLFVENNFLYFKDYRGKKQKVGVIYRRISDEYLDPMTFLPESLIGVPGIMDVYRSGNVAIVNAPGNGVADDKGIYYFVPKMIKYYLGEDAILKNAPTYLLFYEEDKKYVLDHLEKLVIKDVAEAGGYGVIFGHELSKEKLAELKQLIEKEARRFIAQEVIDFQDMDIMEGNEQVPRKADLRAFVLSGEKTKVWASGLTRFSRNPDSLVANMNRAYDNAIVLRDEISSNVLSYIQLALDTIEEGHSTTAPLFDLRPVLDYLLAFWGCVDDYVEKEECRNIMKCGKYVERLDLYIRLNYQMKDIEKEFNKLVNRIHKTQMCYNIDNLDRLTEMLNRKADWKTEYQEALGYLGGNIEVR